MTTFPLLTSLWRYRGFISDSIKRELKSKYGNSLLGAAWKVLSPLSMILVYTLIFSKLMGTRLPGSAGPFAYSIYLCAGVLTWRLFAEITTRISRAGTGELEAWLEHNPAVRAAPLKIGYSHLGANIPQAPAKDTQADAASSAMQARPSLRLVATLESRKGHARALAAFEHLWAQGVVANMVIVGKQGWMVEQLFQRLRSHPESGKRLFLAEGASDTALLQIYGAASVLLAASESEGFGLPLIEASQRGLAIIERDLPMFMEVAGEHAFYFRGQTLEALVDSLSQWLDLHAAGKAPSSASMPRLKWKYSADPLLQVVVGNDWYRTVH